ncbi:hypothetical protein [Gardnerella vaginalis]|uniref:Uncharacterized protein n=1 Tax=Gardnerella vaginalis TaxID=2702 RepID=A0A133NSB8_GARVA|nr:hypothetical protein [Gardnerella vaginalis]EPI42466.1 hypothetical protein HMPREF1585_00901 [Gardnerella vaginalis JCP8481B]EPI44070.1 hypothetical protein HMPREF1584_00331 [Gardnerella vaginalis JCP8481A]KXA19179.1 hypothetical protein HMPREF3208_01164 [Gardnerella vaginalis]
MQTYYEWQWLIQRTQQCARCILAESAASRLEDWQGLAAEYFRQNMVDLAQQAYALYDVRGGI